jgi:oligopeptide/dipeptide ABC transporter ATP-binding protein
VAETRTVDGVAGDEVILEVRDLAKVFPVRRGVVLRRTVGTVQAVDGVSLTLRRGHTVGLVGESGSGKTTLARMLVGVERPTGGQVLVDGVDVSTMSRTARRALRRRVQMVFQDPYTSLNPRMSVGEIVGEPFRIHPDAVPKGSRDRAVRDLLELVGLDPAHVNRYPHQFSGGQRQRIGIARALAVKPQVLVCDEPVSALDVSVQGQVINLLEDLQDELGLSYLFIAHDLAVVRHIADEVAVMYLGRIVEHGSATAVYDRATHPYTRALMSAVPVPDPAARLASPEIVLEGDLPSPADPPTGCRFHTRCWLAKRLVAAGEPAADGVPLRCATESPALADSDAVGHLAACHYSEQAALATTGGPG